MSAAQAGRVCLMLGSPRPHPLASVPRAGISEALSCLPLYPRALRRAQQGLPSYLDAAQPLSLAPGLGVSQNGRTGTHPPSPSPSWKFYKSTPLKATYSEQLDKVERTVEFATFTTLHLEYFMPLLQDPA